MVGMIIIICISALLPVAKEKRTCSFFQRAVDSGLLPVDDYPRTTGIIADDHLLLLLSSIQPVGRNDILFPKSGISRLGWQFQRKRSTNWHVHLPSKLLT